MEVGENMGKHFDLVVVDPPFLAEECLNKNYVAMKYLSKDKIILCTGTFCYINLIISTNFLILQGPKCLSWLKAWAWLKLNLYQNTKTI